MPDRMTRHLSHTSLLVVAAALAFAGCHKYVPVAYGPETETSPVERGTRVRVHLSEPGEYRLGEVTPSNVVEIDGEFVRLDASRLVLSGWRLEAASGREYFGRGESVEIPRSSVAWIRERRVAALETGLLVAGTVAASVAAGAVVISGGDREGSGNGNPPPPSELVVPILVHP